MPVLSPGFIQLEARVGLEGGIKGVVAVGGEGWTPKSAIQVHPPILLPRATP